MKPNNIIFADLSTYTPEASIAFYETVFGWKYYQQQENYTAYLGNQPIAGLYETPERFKQMRMPHFWMTYIQVNSTADTVEQARTLGGIIEMEQDLLGFGKVALIRDPQGAGFTIYEGESLPPTRTDGEANTLIWNELHISNIQRIIPFYEGIFDWTFQQRVPAHFDIYNSQEQHIADALVIPNEYKGKYEYWVCSFGTKKLSETKGRILAQGGSIVTEKDERVLCTDHSGQAFFYIQAV